MTTHHRAGSGKQPVGPESQLWRVRQDFDPHSLASDSILITGKGPRKSLRILEKLHPIISLGPSWKQTAPSNGVTDGVQSKGPARSSSLWNWRVKVREDEQKPGDLKLGQPSGQELWPL